MPRELVHGFVALKALEETEELSKTILHNSSSQNAFLLGTCTPDSGYYNQSPFAKGEHISDLLHNSKSYDSFFLIKNILLDKSVETAQRDLLRAFCLGYMSHILIDSYFHPYIFRITGDYYDPNLQERVLARARHRKLEILIDLILDEHYSLSNESFFMTTYLKELTKETTSLDLILTNKLGIKTGLIKKSWKWHSQFQKIFTNAFLSKNSSMLPISVEFKALFNDHDKKKLDHVKNSISAFYYKGFESVIADSINRLAETFKSFEKNQDEFLNSVDGPSPNSGKVGVLNYDGEYEIDNAIL